MADGFFSMEYRRHLAIYRLVAGGVGLYIGLFYHLASDILVRSTWWQPSTGGTCMGMLIPHPLFLVSK